MFHPHRELKIEITRRSSFAFAKSASSSSTTENASGLPPASQSQTMSGAKGGLPPARCQKRAGCEPPKTTKTDIHAALEAERQLKWKRKLAVAECVANRLFCINSFHILSGIKSASPRGHKPTAWDDMIKMITAKVVPSRQASWKKLVVKPDDKFFQTARQ